MGRAAVEVEHVTDGALGDPGAAITADASVSAGSGGFVRISELDGVPLFFARGVEPRPQTFSIEPRFRRLLIRTVNTVRARAPQSFGGLTRITSAGVLVAKPGFHWARSGVRPRRVDVRAREHPPDSSRPRGAGAGSQATLLVLAALMRSRSALVLHGEFNAAYADHIHHDDGGDSRGRPSTHLF
jgi:hypothetical protein